MARTSRSRFSAALAVAALACGAALTPAHATPLDKLFGGKTIVVGNLVFSDFSTPVMISASPSNIDVQGVVVTDPVTGAQQTGLRFAIIPKAFSLSAKGGSHEVAFWIDYSVTDTTGQLQTITASTTAAAAGQAGYLFTTDSSPNINIAHNVGVDATRTSLEICNWFGSVCADGPGVIVNQPGVVGPIVQFPFEMGVLNASAPLFPGAVTYYVQHEMDLQIANRKGTAAGTATLQDFTVLFSE